MRANDGKKGKESHLSMSELRVVVHVCYDDVQCVCMLFSL